MKTENGIENEGKRRFRCQDKNYVNQATLSVASKLRKKVSFDAIVFLHVHLRRETSVLVHMGWHRKRQKRLFSMPFFIFETVFAFRACLASREVYQYRPCRFYCRFVLATACPLRYNATCTVSM
ncbi:MAG: hypothetical protein Q4A04_04875 [Eubacteriales bacterium]|nr:hypothetical protein [Eubacteriales bacterium]